MDMSNSCFQDLANSDRRNNDRIIALEVKVEHVETALDRVASQLDKVDRKLNYILALVSGGAAVFFFLFHLAEKWVVK